MTTALSSVGSSAPDLAGRRGAPVERYRVRRLRGCRKALIHGLLRSGVQNQAGVTG
jgi:hypothetical protein